MGRHVTGGGHLKKKTIPGLGPSELEALTRRYAETKQHRVNLASDEPTCVGLAPAPAGLGPSELVRGAFARRVVPRANFASDEPTHLGVAPAPACAALVVTQAPTAVQGGAPALRTARRAFDPSAQATAARSVKSPRSHKSSRSKPRRRFGAEHVLVVVASFVALAIAAGAYLGRHELASLLRHQAPAYASAGDGAPRVSSPPSEGWFATTAAIVVPIAPAACRPEGEASPSSCEPSVVTTGAEAPRCAVP
jgi:hypothetical protein